VTEPILIVIGDVLHEPWYSISVDGQMRTWLHDVDDDPRFHIRHSHSQPLGVIGGWFDRTHESARWWDRTRGLIPRLDDAIGRPWREKRARVSVGTWAGSSQVAWSQAMPDLYALQRWKIVTSMTQALTEDNWAYVYFTTASSYVRTERLRERVEALPRARVYAGTLMVEGVTGEAFASGANRVFSRDVVELVVRNRREYSNDVMEDVGLGRLLTKHGIHVTAWPSLNLTSQMELDAVSDAELLEHHHFRLRSEKNGRRNDVELMHALHDRLRLLESA
jgi:hypothetical protein